MTYAKHKYNIFPEMLGEDYERLKTDLQTNGFDRSQPIWLYNNEVLDGWNRQRACLELNIKPIYNTFVGTETEAVMFVMRTNKRRNLNSSQWAAIAVEAEDIIKAISEAVEAERVRKISENNANQYTEQAKKQQNIFSEPKKENATTQLIAPSLQTKKENTETRQIIAETFNTNRTYINEAAKLKQTNPEKFEQVKQGVKTLTEVKKEVKIETRKAEILKQVEQIKNGELPELKGMFDVVSIDPPWAYGREYNPESSRVANPYPEMTTEQIKNIQLPLNKDSIVFLWTTHQFLPDAFDILKYWGLEYKATITWNKEKMGMGVWLRMQCEFCLLAIKGSPFWQNTTERDIISEPRREHSRKPDAFFNMVDRICVGRKLEYFSREKRSGWEIFGNDVNKF